MRVPLSVAALLEARAVYAELVADTRFIAGLDGDERLVATKVWTTEIIDRLYTARLAAYSVAAHVVANNMKSKDALVAYRCASILSGIALNMPPEYFKNLRIPEEFDPWRDAVPHLISNRDRGFAFLVLAKSMPEGEPESLAEWVERTLENAGLPSASEFGATVQKELEKYSSSASAIFSLRHPLI